MPGERGQRHQTQRTTRRLAPARQPGAGIPSATRTAANGCRRRWRSGRPADRAGARRAGLTALAVLIVTAALAVLLAVLFHLAWPPVLVAILGTVPALYLAWLAVPGVVSPPGPGAATRPTSARRAGRRDPVELGVHQVIGGRPMPGLWVRVRLAGGLLTRQPR
jgi:hypothetical protein